MPWPKTISTYYHAQLGLLDNSWLSAIDSTVSLNMNRKDKLHYWERTYLKDEVHRQS